MMIKKITKYTELYALFNNILSYHTIVFNKLTLII